MGVNKFPMGGGMGGADPTPPNPGWGPSAEGVTTANQGAVGGAPMGPGVPPSMPGAQANAELMEYFISQGMNPVTAAQLSTRVIKVSPPPVPISNGISAHPNDAVTNLLTSKYGLSPQEAKGFMQGVYADRKHPADIKFNHYQDLESVSPSNSAAKSTRVDTIANFAEGAKGATAANAGVVQTKSKKDLEDAEQLNNLASQETRRLHTLGAYSESAKLGLNKQAWQEAVDAMNVGGE